MHLYGICKVSYVRLPFEVADSAANATPCMTVTLLSVCVDIFKNITSFNKSLSEDYR